MNTDQFKFFCHLCLGDNDIEIGELIPGYWLVKKADQEIYALSANDHFSFNFPDRAIYVWEIKPEIEIFEEDNLHEADLQFERVRKFITKKTLDPIAGYMLIYTSLRCGYHFESGSIEWWLFHLAGRLVQNYEDNQRLIKNCETSKNA